MLLFPPRSEGASQNPAHPRGVLLTVPDLHRLNNAIVKTVKALNVKIWTLEQTWRLSASSFKSIF